MQVLREARALKPTHTVGCKGHFPSGVRYELICVDDHVGVSVENRGAQVGVSSIEDSFAKAEAFYRTVWLVVNKEKSRSRNKQATILGAEILGDAGLIGSARVRRLFLG